MSQKRRFGAILVYVGLAMILGALLVGGVIFMKRYEGSASKDTPPAPIIEHSDQTDTTKEPEHKPQTEGAPRSEASTARPVHLPQTGPESSLMGGLGLSVMTAMVVAYIRSRRDRAVL